MAYAEIVHPDQLKLLTEAWEAHCAEHMLEDEFEREDAAWRIMSLFTSGAASAEDLLAICSLRLSEAA